jgi:hypothetical protein
MPAVLVLSAQLLRCAFCMPADGLTHRLVGGDALSERTAADNLLFWRGLLPAKCTALRSVHEPFSPVPR